MKSILTFSTILFCSFLQAQNLYISSGGYFSNLRVDVINEYIVRVKTIPTTRTALDRFNGISFHPDFLNLLFEEKINTHFSIKSGVYLHTKKTTWSNTFVDKRMYHGTESWREVTFENEVSVSSIDFPLLFAYNFQSGNKLFSLKNINLGPYFGKTLAGNKDGYSSIPVYSYKFDYGLFMSAGFGSEKWQISLYVLKGLRNIYKSNIYYYKVKKITSDILGVNLTKIIHFSKKATPLAYK